MLNYLRGTIQAKEITGSTSCHLVIETGGIAFDLTVSSQTLATIGELGDQVVVHTSLCIRENEWTIFGFKCPNEREMFSLVQSVSGVGPKMALALVGTFGAKDLAETILAENHKMLTQAPGIGPKLAQRIVLEVRSKVEDWLRKQGLTQNIGLSKRNVKYEEVQSILTGLGYTPTEINMAIRQAEEANLEGDVEILVSHSLRLLGTV